MKNKVFVSLEFDKIKNILKEYAITYLGIEKVNELLPSSDIEMVRKWQEETSVATSLLLRKNDLPLSPLTNIDDVIRKVLAGGVLIPKELLQVADVLRVSRKLKQYSTNDNVELSILQDYFDNLYTNKGVEEEIERAIKSEDEIDDRASKTLYNIRRKITDIEAQIKDKLNEIIRSNSKYLQDDVVTFRNDRFVIPVKQEYKNEVQGFVHDYSSTGSTVFIEPTSILNKNNEIRELKNEEKLEIERILALLTQMILPIVEQVQWSLENVGMIDFIFAKAKYGLSINAFKPNVNNENRINLKSARHPLIDSQKVVPIDIWLGKDFNTLIITGPNTGGKTVTLKTVGLLTLMAQAGLHIPASESSEVAIFENIYTDIGDEQSIEQSLSTFSAHMTNIVNILKEINSNSLVLLDELGSGTDPVEGAALAMSILDYLHSISCLTIATTHYSELKTYAIQTPGVENASCEFDVETLSPTYRLLIGLPGKSNAFAISKRLGLDGKILEKANSYLTSENIKFEDVLSDMELDRRKAKEERELSQKMLIEANDTKKRIDDEQKKLETKKDEILFKAKKEARDILIEAEEQANDIIKELTLLKKQKSNDDRNKRAEENRNKLKKSISEIQKDLTIPNKEVKNLLKPEEIIVGSTMYIPSLDQKVTILANPDKKGNVYVQSGIVKLAIHISQLEKIENDEKKKNVVVNSRVTNKAQTISSEVNLLGNTVDEAVDTLDKYLDDAYLSGISQVRIVHGKGSGALRAGIHQYLKTNPHVKSYRLGVYGEGDTRSYNCRNWIIHITKEETIWIKEQKYLRILQ